MTRRLLATLALVSAISVFHMFSHTSVIFGSCGGGGGGGGGNNDDDVERFLREENERLRSKINDLEEEVK